MKSFLRKLLPLPLGGLMLASSITTGEEERNHGSEPKKQIRIIDLQATEVEPANAHDADTVLFYISVQPSQFRACRDQRKLVEARFYVGSKSGQTQRIWKAKDIYLSSARSEHLLDADDACPTLADGQRFVGKRFAKVWLSLRDAHGNPDPRFEAYSEEFPYYCHDRRDYRHLHAEIAYRLAEPVARNRFTKFRLKVGVDGDQWGNLRERDEKVLVTLTVVREGQRYRVKERSYSLPTNKAEYTFPIRDICGSLHGLFEDIWGTEVEVGAHLQVVRPDGDRDYRYSEFDGPTQKLTCFN